MQIDDGGPSLRSSINVTPLADVMLVLLIIFMVVTPMLGPGVEVKVPESRHAFDHPESDEALVLSMTHDGRIHLNADPVPVNEVLPLLTSTLAERTDKTLFLRASEVLDYGDVLEMMDRCRAAGAVEIALVTREAENIGR